MATLIVLLSDLKERKSEFSARHGSSGRTVTKKQRKQWHSQFRRYKHFSIKHFLLRGAKLKRLAAQLAGGLDSDPFVPLTARPLLLGRIYSWLASTFSSEQFLYFYVKCFVTWI